jgi:hypothetical protein
MCAAALAIDPGAIARIYAQRQPANDSDARRYLLSAQEGSRIFREEIVPDLFAGREPQVRPTVVFLVGQHGAGKTRVADMVAGTLNKRGGFADLDSDLYKPYHPRYDELMSRNDTLMAAYIGPDSWAWLTQANEYVRLHKLNALKPETGQHPGAAANIRAYRDADFRIEVMVIGLSSAVSNQGIISRYHEQVLDRGHGRLTVQANADRAYTGILDLADIIDDERLADEVGVFRRGEATPRYGNSLTSAGQWQDSPALRAAIEGERVRPWTAGETGDFLRTHTRLRQELGPEWTQRLDQILEQAQPLMEPSEAEQASIDLAATEPGSESTPQSDASDDLRRTLEAARSACTSASARQSLAQRQADADADDAGRQKALSWRAATDQRLEAICQREQASIDAGAEADPEADR